MRYPARNFRNLFFSVNRGKSQRAFMGISTLLLLLMIHWHMHETVYISANVDDAYLLKALCWSGLNLILISATQVAVYKLRIRPCTANYAPYYGGISPYTARRTTIVIRTQVLRKNAVIYGHESRV